MELEIPANKIYNHQQLLALENSVMTFEGEKDCDKSEVLESIFKKYLIDIQKDTDLVAFLSGNNESFSSIFQKKTLETLKS